MGSTSAWIPSPISPSISTGSLLSDSFPPMLDTGRDLQGSTGFMSNRSLIMQSPECRCCKISRNNTALHGSYFLSSRKQADYFLRFLSQYTPGIIRYGTFTAHASHFFPNDFFNNLSSSAILINKATMTIVYSGAKSPTYNFTGTVFITPDSRSHDPREPYHRAIPQYCAKLPE